MHAAAYAELARAHTTAPPADGGSAPPSGAPPSVPPPPPPPPRLVLTPPPSGAPHPAVQGWLRLACVAPGGAARGRRGSASHADAYAGTGQPSLTPTLTLSPTLIPTLTLTLTPTPTLTIT